MSEEIIQRSPEWYAERCGKITGSRVADIMRKTKSGYSATRKNYLAEIVIGRLTGQPADSYTSPAMQWGIDHEDEAAEMYSALTFNDCEKTGFVNHPDIPSCGVSPDRLIGVDGLVEIKCPNTATHIETLITGEIDKDYIVQMQMQMSCTGRKWCDFVSYDPRLPGDLKIFIKRVNRDNEFIADMESEIVKFLAEVDDTVERLLHIAEKKSA